MLLPLPPKLLKQIGNINRSKVSEAISPTDKARRDTRPTTDRRHCGNHQATNPNSLATKRFTPTTDASR